MDTKSLLFIGGDISGIQKFIYNISSKKAAVSLKGRSTYLVQYTEHICNGLLQIPLIANCSKKDIIYCSGGKFYIIVEDTPDIRKAITDYADKVEAELWHKHYGQLGIAIVYLPFYFTSSEETRVVVNGKEDKIGLLWTEMTALFTAKKSQKFLHILVDEYDSFFKVQNVGGDVHVCAITGIESDECVKLDKDKNGDSIWVLPSVKEQVELGIKLRDKENFKTFEEYAKDENGNPTYLGILRMDVDKLGARFCKGFDSLQSYSRFSSHLKEFFDTRVPAMQQNECYKDYLNIIYAGGDDLFVVGRWDKVIEFAADVHNAFVTHTAGENLSISGGIAIVGAKFPIAKAAEMAGDAEDKAKEYNNGAKNAICFLGETVGWDNEFNEVRTLKNEFYHQIKDNGLSQGILHQLMKYAAMATEGKSFSYLWHSAYYLTRLTERCSPEAKNFVKELRNQRLTKGVREYQLTALAARWAELELRITKSK